MSPRLPRAEKRVTLRTGRGACRGAAVCWNRRRYVWNDDQDAAYLRDPKGRQPDSCSYKAGSDSASVTC
ncbi:hypothetical protein AB0K12_08350 [Nonomuraea sp. NPDC049419]|uniref:hypothetical protein n=1 Tax=Nonomuraea sp. NPDC049419 TaxID=3155772 RepID=UPI0034293B68